MTTRDTYGKVSIYYNSSSTKLFPSCSIPSVLFHLHKPGYHYHSYFLGLVLMSTNTIHEYTYCLPTPRTEPSKVEYF